MKKNKIKLVIEATITIPVQSGQEDLFEEVVQELEDGKPSAWTMESVIESIDWDYGISVVEVRRADEELSPEDELDFDYEE